MRWLPAAMSLSVLLSLSLPAAPQGATCPWALSGGKETRAAQALPADGPVQSWWLEFTQGAGDTDAALAAPVEKGPDGPLAVLYRVVNAAGGALSLCLTTDGVPGPSQTLDPSGNWHAASLAAKQPPISGRLALRLSGAAGSVVQLLLPQSPLAPPSPAQALRSLAQHCASSGAHDEAQAAYEGVAALAPGTGEAATALRGAGDSRRAAGATEAAVESYLRALDECGSATDGWQSFPGAQGYSQNREAVDLETALRDRLFEAAGGASPLVAARALRAAALQLPPTPSSRAAALACARL